MEEEKKAVSVWKTIKPFVNGGASGMLATCVVQPIDMVKVRYSTFILFTHSINFPSDWIYVFLIDWFMQKTKQVRIQLGQGSAVHITKNMLRDEGLSAFYKVLLFLPLN